MQSWKHVHSQETKFCSKPDNLKWIYTTSTRELYMRSVLQSVPVWARHFQITYIFNENIQMNTRNGNQYAFLNTPKYFCAYFLISCTSICKMNCEIRIINTILLWINFCNETTCHFNTPRRFYQSMSSI